jgi:hypothetical protein
VGGTRRQLDEVGLLAVVPVRLVRHSHALMIRGVSQLREALWGLDALGSRRFESRHSCATPGGQERTPTWQIADDR